MTTHEPTRDRTAGRPRARRRWSGEGVLTLVVATALTATGVGLLGAGAPALWVDQQQRDRDGFVTTDERVLRTPTAALVATPLEVALDRPVDGFLVRRALGDVRVQVEGPPGDALFVGLGPARAVEDYLRGVPVDRVRDVAAGAPVAYDRRDGRRRPDPPAQQDLWVASAQGTGRLDLDWRVRDGRWALVVMRPDGGAGVRAEVGVGATLPSLTWVAAGLVAVGGLLLSGGLVLLASLARPLRRRPRADGPPDAGRPVPLPRTGPDAPSPAGAAHGRVRR